MNGYERVRTAVVGAGAVSDWYLENMIGRLSILEVVAIASRRGESARAQAAKYAIEARTLDEILADRSIELVVNLTTPAAHHGVIKAAFEAGKHVYTEKVLTVELADAAELVGLAAERSLYFGSAPDTFLGSAIQTARWIVDSGLIGEVTSCYAALNRDYSILGERLPFIWEPGGGIGFDVGIYYMTALASILGPVEEVSGFMKTNRPNRSHRLARAGNLGEPYEVRNETVMVGSLVFASGVFGSLHFNSDSIQNERPALVLLGTEGLLYLPDPNLFGGPVSIVRKGHDEPFVVQQNHGFADQSRGVGAAELAWALRAGRAPRASKEMAYHCLEVLHGIATSSATRRAVSITSTFERPAPLPQGYRDRGYWDSDEETALAL